MALDRIAHYQDKPKGVMDTEQLNIEGKRSGSGFVIHKSRLVDALIRADAERIDVIGLTIGRRGFLAYIKALAGSIIKIVPSTSGGDSASHTTDKKLKVVCGNNTSYLDDSAWIGDKTPFTQAELKVSPKTAVKPNIGSVELAEALSRVLPFTAKEDNRPVLQCVLFRVKEGKLILVSADGFRLATVTLDIDGDEGEVLIHRDSLRTIANALRRALRVKVSIDKAGDSLDGMSLAVDTELIRYRWHGAEGSFPDYEKLIPNEFNASVSFDTNEALKAVGSLKVLADAKSYPIDLAIGNGKLIMSNPDNRGQTELNADTEGEVKIRIEGNYLADALRACGGMVDLKLTNAYSPMLFSVDGYQLVTMPMMTSEANEQAKRDSEPKEAEKPAVVAEAEKIAEQAERVAQVEAQLKPKRKHKSKKAVAVA